MFGEVLRNRLLLMQATKDDCQVALPGRLVACSCSNIRHCIYLLEAPDTTNTERVV